jgi:hypothetical protein
MTNIQSGLSVAADHSPAGIARALMMQEGQQNYDRDWEPNAQPSTTPAIRPS